MNRTPPVLFSYDQSFRTDWNMTVDRQSKRDKIDDLCANYGIKLKQVVYIGKKKYEKRSYVTEKHELIQRFFRLWGIKKRTLIFADNGNSTKKLSELDFHGVKYYPAAIHQYLSPIDNGLHGPAKTKWRNMIPTFADNIESSLYLLHELNVDDAETVRGWFKRCWLLDVAFPSDAQVDELLGGGAEENEFFRRCRELHMIYVLDRPKRGGIGNVQKPCAVDCELDGSYWTEFECKWSKK